MTRAVVRLFVACALLAPAAAARATVIIGADLGQLARDARFIVRGRVVATTPRWTADHRTIETLVSIESEAYLKGSAGPVLEFAVPGGRLGRYRNIVVGAPTFAIGDRVVVFLGGRGPGLPFLLGLGQGVYRIVPAPDATPRWIVTPPPLLPASGEPARIRRGDPERRPLPLAAFEERVRALAGSAP